MLVLETVAKIRRAYFVQRKTIKSICHELRVSRKVMRKVLRSEATEFHYERGEQPLPRIGPWQETLDGMLASNEANPVRERLMLIRIFEALHGVGYEGGYDAVRRLARAWQRDRDAATSVDAFVPLSFAPGEAYLFDWSHGDGEGGARASVPQPDAVCASLPTRDAGWCSTHMTARSVFSKAPAPVASTTT